MKVPSIRDQFIPSPSKCLKVYKVASFLWLMLLVFMVMEALTLLVLFALSVTIAFSIKSPYRRRVRGPLPPGPRPLPIIGNILDFPQTNIWQEFSELSRRYGEL